MHQEVSVAFAPNESHNGCLLAGPGLALPTAIPTAYC